MLNAVGGETSDRNCEVTKEQEVASQCMLKITLLITLLARCGQVRHQEIEKAAGTGPLFDLLK